MVSLEEEMKQKDKEAAVLKANHKYEMLLNLELERIEKCKRTYEHFHHFEVAVMKDRHNRILQKQIELKVQKNLSKLDITDLQPGREWRKSQSQIRASEKYLSNNNKTNSARNLNPTGKTSDKTNVTKSLAQPKDNSSHTVVPVSSEQNQRLRRANYANVMQYANLPAARLVDKPNSEKKNFHESVQVTNTPSAEEVRLPVLQATSFSVKSSAKTNCESPIKRHAHFPENLTQTHVMHSRDVRTPSTVFRKKKKTYRTANAHLSSFDQYRLRLQESEQRTWKPRSRHYFPRAISAMEYNVGTATDDTLTAIRRARSADVQ